MGETVPVTTLAEILAAATRRLSEAGVPDARLDARLIVEHAVGISHRDLISRPDMPVGEERRAALDAMIARRIEREPVHRIIGMREFHGLPMRLSPETLEPRPDTEILVDAAIVRARTIVERSGRCDVLDLGTGTGAVAIAILHEVASAQALAVDISDEALETAAGNADMNGVGDRLRIVRSSWFGAVEGLFDLIVSNPPYIASAELEELAPEVRFFDPPTALDGGADGLDAYRQIAAGAGAHMREGAFVAVETGHAQFAQVMEIFQRKGYFLDESLSDLEGRDRVLIFTR